MIGSLVFVLTLLPIIVDATFPCGKAPLAQQKYHKLDPLDYSPATAFKVLSGEVPSKHIFPFVVSVQYSKVQHFCTGTIIGPRHVLTAAHCFYTLYNHSHVTKERFINYVFVRHGALGVHDGEVSKIKNIYTTPNSNNKKYDDILIIELDEEIKFNENTQPICLSANALPEINKELIIAGFGNHSIGEDKYETPNTYIVDTIPVLENNFCSAIKNDTFCAGGVEKGSMKGDSGGPLMSLYNHRFYQVGVVISGITSQKTENGHRVRTDRGLYLYVADYCDFIKETTKGEVFCR